MLINVNGKEFKKVPGFEYYYASADGEIYSIRANRILTSRIYGCYPYLVTRIANNKQQVSMPTHKMVALAWCPLPNGISAEDVLGNYISRNLVVDHINRNKLDNRAENLRGVTQFENLQNMDINYRKEIMKKIMKGNQNAKGRKKHEGPCIRYIYIYENKEYTLSTLAKELNCSRSKITESFRRNLGLVREGKLTRKQK